MLVLSQHILNQLQCWNATRNRWRGWCVLRNIGICLLLLLLLNKKLLHLILQRPLINFGILVIRCCNSSSNYGRLHHLLLHKRWLKHPTILLIWLLFWIIHVYLLLRLLFADCVRCYNYLFLFVLFLLLNKIYLVFSYTFPFSASSYSLPRYFSNYIFREGNLKNQDIFLQLF